MPLFKCKMCGGDLEISEGLTVAECEYCGTKQTLPKLDDERRANMYDRANHFRRNNEFDKAMGIYENILNEDGTDAEAYWSIVLCRYGIEYVEDPATKRRIPTVNRAQFTSIFDDEDYKSAVANADAHQRAIYEAEAEAINKIQKGILAISQKEEPFDVFICYKETDNNGRRTPDSVLAQELYYGLKNEGFKVFFSRITLEDKLGSAYEPYIFAALNSAKVMVVLGTRPEYFNAVWVKNEWSRYLSLIKGGAKKVIIPAYKDMDPYDLPEEFSHLQAQDMSKLGFMQDLIRGIKKLASASEQKATVVKETVVREAPVMTQNIGISPLLDRAFMFLEDGEFDRADEFLENVLNQDPRNAEAYVGKLLVDLKVKTKEMLTVYPTPFDENGNYKKAIRFGDDKLRAELEGVIVYINTRNETARLEDVYCRAKTAMQLARTEISCKDAANIFETIRSYKDSEELIAECLEKAEEIRKDSYLNKARVAMTHNNIVQYEEAIKILGFIPGWKDADELVDTYKQRIAKIKEKAEADRIERERKAEISRQENERIAKRNKIIAIIVTPIAVAVIVVLIVLYTVIIPNKKYNDAYALMEAGNLVEAYEIFTEIDGYKDSAKIIAKLKTDAITQSEAYYLKGNINKAQKIAEHFNLPLAEAYRCVARGDYNAAVYAGLTHIVIPNGVTKIESYDFAGNSSLSAVTIPESVTYIGCYAFQYCESLTSVNFKNPNGWNIPSENNLRSKTTAALCLTTTYVSHDWVRN